MIHATINRKDPVTLRAMLATAFAAHDPNRADLTGTPQIETVEFGLTPNYSHEHILINFHVNNKPYGFFYDFDDEQADGWLYLPEDQVGSDDDPDWESNTPDMGLALLAFIAAIKEGKLK